ncbi:MAG: hypothetical protein QGF09_18090, partial [Rhodospirillales bacterium]|nr:hypothetical protein [Rhodospirillales bacterium]
PEGYRWSSARAHLRGSDEGALKVGALLGRVGDWGSFLDDGLGEEDLRHLRGLETTGRPAGSESFIEALESRLGRSLKKQKPGPKTRDK